jgi:hypothetical protein
MAGRAAQTQHHFSRNARVERPDGRPSDARLVAWRYVRGSGRVAADHPEKRQSGYSES